jgi:hypothetical protein
MHMLQSLFYLTITLHVSGIIITQLQEHKSKTDQYAPPHTHISSNSSTIAADNNTVCTSFIILQNIFRFPKNIHYQQKIVILI